MMACPMCPVGVYMPGVRGEVGALVEGTPAMYIYMYVCMYVRARGLVTVVISSRHHGKLTNHITQMTNNY